MSPPLFDYQKLGALWLSERKYALLADEMGLGKSAQAIGACDLLGAKRILVVCPAIARSNWIREFKKFSILTRELNCVLTQEKSALDCSNGVTVVSYDLLLTKGDNFLQQRDCLILDEVHYLKNRTAKRTQAVFNSLLPRADRVWALSGTPAPNHAGELYPWLRATGVWTKDYWAFVRRYCKTRETVYGTQIVGIQRVEELRGLLAPGTLRRKKEDVMKDLPPILFSDMVVEGTPLTPDADANLLSAFESGTAALDTRRLVGLAKVPAIIEIIKDELENNAYDKIVLFAIHHDVIDALTAGLHKYSPLVITGKTPLHSRDRAITAFQRDPERMVFIGNVQAAGTAITLTAAHQVGFVEASWVPAENAQAAMRVHRIGQTKPVTVRFFSLAGSSDEHVQEVLARKTKDITAVFDTSGVSADPDAN